MKIQHPTKGEFDTATATWQATYDNNGNPGDFDIGISPDGALTAVRDRERPEDPLGYLVFNSAEWEAFKQGVANGVFDDDALHHARETATRGTSNV